MANRSILFQLCLIAYGSVPFAQAQSLSDLLARMDQFAKTFSGAKANLRSVNYVVGLGENDVTTGTILIKRTAGKSQIRIDMTGPNTQTVVVREQVAEIYHPKLNEIQQYDLRAYKDVQQYFLLGFGMPGRELAANYEIRNVKAETVESEAATHIELIPKSPEVLKQLKSVEIWISDKTQCPARQIFHFPDGGSQTATFSDMQVNPKFPGDAFDLPKSAKRVRVN